MMLANFRNDCSALFRVLFTVMVLTLGISGVHANVVINSFNSATDWGNNKTTPNLLTLTRSGFSNTNLEANRNLFLAVSNGTGIVTMDVPSLAGMPFLLLSMKSGDAAEEEIDIGVFDGSWHDVELERAGYGSLGGEYSPFNIPLADFNANVSSITQVRITFSSTASHSLRIDHLCAATQNIAIGKTPVLTDDEGQYDADLAVDGNRITRWGTSHLNNYWVNHWIKVDLGSNNNVNGVYIHWETAAAAEYTVQVSQDDSNWTTVATITNGVSAESRYLDFASVTSRYVRVNCTKKTSEIYGYSIWELEVYGQTIPVPAAPSGLDLQVTGMSQIDLSWTDNASSEIGYYIYRSATSTKPGSPAYTPAANAQSFTATGLTPETQYYFWVEAYNSYGSSSHISGNISLNYGGFVADDFNRADGEVIGGGWTELEIGTSHTVGIQYQKLQFLGGDTDDLRPMVKKSFPVQNSGYIEWNFIMEWTHSSEDTYEVRMQLGSGMNDDDISQGVGVDLRWGDDQQPLKWHSEGGFGFVNGAGEEVQVSPGPVSGSTVVKVVASIADKTYDIYLGGQLVHNGAPFRMQVQSLSEARLFTKNLGDGIIGQTFDDVILRTGDYHTITASGSGPGGTISPVGKICVPDGGSRSFDISYSNAETKITEFLIDAAAAPFETPYIFSNVTGDRSISVTFQELAEYTITTTVVGNGTIIPVVPGPYKESFTYQFDFAPQTGFEVSDVLVDDVSVGKVPSYTFHHLAGDHTLQVTFAKLYLPILGGMMAGDIDMDAHDILGVNSFGALTLRGSNNIKIGRMVPGDFYANVHSQVGLYSEKAVLAGPNDLPVDLTLVTTQVETGPHGQAHINFGQFGSGAAPGLYARIEAAVNYGGQAEHLSFYLNDFSNPVLKIEDGAVDMSGVLKALSGAEVTGSITVSDDATITGNVGIGQAPTEGYKLDVFGKIRSNEEVSVGGSDASSSLKSYELQLASSSNTVIIGSSLANFGAADISSTGELSAAEGMFTNTLNVGNAFLSHIDPNTVTDAQGVVIASSTRPVYTIHDADDGAADNPVFQFKKGPNPESTGKFVNVEYDGEKLTVWGDLKANSVITSSWKIQPADYVFEPDYDLRDLKEVESFVKQNRHLPDVPSGKEMQEKGLDLAAMNMQLLRKVEELTLYAISQEKRITELEKKIRD